MANSKILIVNLDGALLNLDKLGKKDAASILGALGDDSQREDIIAAGYKELVRIAGQGVTVALAGNYSAESLKNIANAIFTSGQNPFQDKYLVGTDRAKKNIIETVAEAAGGSTGDIRVVGSTAEDYDVVSDYNSRNNGANAVFAVMQLEGSESKLTKSDIAAMEYKDANGFRDAYAGFTALGLKYPYSRTPGGLFH